MLRRQEWDSEMSESVKMVLIASVPVLLLVFFVIMTFLLSPHGEHNAEQACMNRGGMPIRAGSGNTMTHCQGVK